MDRYTVYVREVRLRGIPVEADSPDEAITVATAGKGKLFSGKDVTTFKEVTVLEGYYKPHKDEFDDFIWEDL